MSATETTQNATPEVQAIPKVSAAEHKSRLARQAAAIRAKLSGMVKTIAEVGQLLTEAEAWHVAQGLKPEKFSAWAMATTGYSYSWVKNAQKAGRVLDTLPDGFEHLSTDALAVLDRVPEDNRVKVLKQAGVTPENQNVPHLETLRAKADLVSGKATTTSQAEKDRKKVTAYEKALRDKVEVVLSGEMTTAEVAVAIARAVGIATAGEERGKLIGKAVRNLANEYDRRQNPDESGLAEGA